LSYTQKLQAIALLENLAEMYDGNIEKLSQFLTTFKAVLKDKSDVLSDEISDTNDEDELTSLWWQKASVDYLYYIVWNYLDDIPHTSTSAYIAPNGKQYLAEYDENRLAYTSPDFMYEKWFPTWELFVSHININNPGNYHAWNNIWEAVVAPNDKLYHVYQINWKRVSDEFIYMKYFDTREQIVDYIFVNNPSATWNHKIDTSFDSVGFTAPNGKQYTIFKTSSQWENPNMYSSFRFVAAKYFPNLQAVKDHITMYNK